jgi:hypothetical protein
MNAIAVEALNQSCFCVPVRQADLDAMIDSEIGSVGFAARLLVTHPHLFSSTAVFVSSDHVDQMMATVAAIEQIARSDPFRQLVLAVAPEIAKSDFGPLGVFMGYDFHISPDGPRLIEVNTNAGGAFLNALLEEARDSCCTENAGKRKDEGATERFVEAVDHMFRAEWALQRSSQPFRHIAIVDRNPENQYLYPEFLLARKMLVDSGFEVSIAAPDDLSFDGKRLNFAGKAIDLVYNRLTDFYFENSESRALRDAYASGAVVVTPNPYHHALYANKQNLAHFADTDLLAKCGLSELAKGALGAIPKTELVDGDQSGAFWAARKDLFFKPVSGHAGKAVYRGDKVTRKVFEDITSGGYIAQKSIPPSERMISLDGERLARKMDVRLYTYHGELLLVAARLYQGQTTNFRTPGGGFAPVLVV